MKYVEPTWNNILTCVVASSWLFSLLYHNARIRECQVSLHCSLSFVFSVHCIIFITFKSATTSSIHLKQGLPLLCLVNSVCSIIFLGIAPTPILCTCPSHLILPRLIVGFRNKLFIRCGVVSPTHNPQPGGPGYPFRLGHHP